MIKYLSSNKKKTWNQILFIQKMNLLMSSFGKLSYQTVLWNAPLLTCGSHR